MYIYADYYCEATNNRLARTWAPRDEDDPHSPWDTRICGNDVANGVWCYYEGDCINPRVDGVRVWQCVCQEGFYGLDCSIRTFCIWFKWIKFIKSFYVY